MIISKSQGENRLSYDGLEVAMAEFITKFNFKPNFFIVGVSVPNVVTAIRLGESINSSSLSGLQFNFIYDSNLENTSWYLLSVKNNEAYQLVM